MEVILRIPATFQRGGPYTLIIQGFQVFEAAVHPLISILAKARVAPAEASFRDLTESDRNCDLCKKYTGH